MNICRVAILQSSKDCSGSICKTRRALRRTRRRCGEINRRKGRPEEVDAKTSARTSDAKASGDNPNNTARQIEKLLDKVQGLWYACKNIGEGLCAKTSGKSPAPRHRITQQLRGLCTNFTTLVPHHRRHTAQRLERVFDSDYGLILIRAEPPHTITVLR